MDINGKYPMFKDLILVKWQCPKLIYALYKPCNYASCLFCRSWQTDPKIHTERQAIQSSQDNLEKDLHWRTRTSQFQNLRQKAGVSQCHERPEDGRTDQWKRTSRERNPCIYGQLNFDKNGLTIQWGKRKKSFPQSDEDWSWTPSSQDTQVRTQNGSQT